MNGTNIGFGNITGRSLRASRPILAAAYGEYCQLGQPAGAVKLTCALVLPATATATAAVGALGTTALTVKLRVTWVAAR